MIIFLITAMKSTRFKSLATEDDNMSQNTFKPISSHASTLPTNSRWKDAEQDMHSNPFRRKNERSFTSSPPAKNSRWHRDDEAEDPKRATGGFQHRDRRGNDGRDCQTAKRFISSSPVLTNSRWRRDPADRSDEPRRATSGFSNSFRGRRGGDERGRGRRRGGDREAFNSFNRKTKRAPKPVFNLEGTNFPALGKVESPSSSPPLLNFSKAAYKNKDRAGPKHVTQRPERMPRTKKSVADDRDPLDWDTDDEEAPDDTEIRDKTEPDWPAKGGYID